MKCYCCNAAMLASDNFRGYLHLNCSRCGFEHFANDAADEEVNASLYETDADYASDLAVAENHRSLLQWSHKKALTSLKSGVRKGGRILDLGCFNGFFVKELVDHGFDAYGIDFNETAIAFGIKFYSLHGRISVARVEDLMAADSKFDAITIFEVIEHLPRFNDLLQQLLHMLAPGGLLIISVPNGRMSWRPPLDYPPHHLSRFQPQSLLSLADSLGLSAAAVSEQASLFDFLRNRVGLLFRKKEGSLRGGAFVRTRFVDFARRCANFMKWSIYVLLKPLDYVLYLLGFRYISQVMVARKDP